MKLKLKRWLCCIFVFIYILTINSCACFATTSEPVVNTPSCILLNLNTGKILYSKNANEKYYPASTTKVMTAILALENCNLTDMATVSHDAVFNVPVGYTNAALVEGEEISIRDLLYALMVPSANDAAFVLAEHIAGTVDNFSDMMNQKAEEIGCKNTHFVNPNGIHSEDHYSTAYDLALIGQYAMKNEALRKIVSTTQYTLPTTNKYDKTDRILSTTNELIKTSSRYYYEYATGCKTGYTDAAKNCIIATAKKDNVELLAVVLYGSRSEDGISLREVDCKTLFEYGFNNFSLEKVIGTTDTVDTIKVSGATSETRLLDLAVDHDIYAFVHSDYDLTSIVPNISLPEKIKAPILKDSVLGTVSYTVDGITYTADLVASHDVNKSNLFKILLVLLLAIVLFILLALIVGRKKKNKIANRNSKLSGNKKNSKISHLDYYHLHH